MAKNNSIIFNCLNHDNKTYSHFTASNRKEALNMIRQDKFKEFRNVVVYLPSGESFNLQSIRSMNYFGINIKD